MATAESGDLSATALEGECFGAGLGFRLERLLWVDWVLLGVDGRGELGCCVDGWLLVCLARLVSRVVVVGGFEAPRLGGEWVYFWGFWMTTNLKLKRPEEMHFVCSCDPCMDDTYGI